MGLGGKMCIPHRADEWLLNFSGGGWRWPVSDPLGNPPHPSFRHLSVVRAKCVSYDWLAKIFFICFDQSQIARVACSLHEDPDFHKAHLVLDAWLEVTQESVGLVVLHLPVLHRATTQEVIQLWGKDRCRSTLILWTLIPCRKHMFVTG